jgi:hypothetical protein
MPWIAPVAAGVSSIVGGRASGREKANEAQLAQDRLRLAQEQAQRETPLLRLRAAGLGDIASGVQDFQLSGRGRELTSTGGLRPSLLREGSARQVGQQVAREALLSAMGGAMRDPRYARDYAGIADIDPYRISAPTPLQKPGLLDKILGGAALGLNVGSGLYDIYSSKKQSKTAP